MPELCLAHVWDFHSEDQGDLIFLISQSLWRQTFDQFPLERGLAEDFPSLETTTPLKVWTDSRLYSRLPSCFQDIFSSVVSAFPFELNCLSLNSRHLHLNA